MGNSYFNFKQFTIEQKGVAMKVGVDSVLLGAHTSVENMENVLDVGTGTGLLALMLAQKNKNLKIDAIDIDEAAIKVADENVANSAFCNQITVLHSSFQDFARINAAKYDLVISNPPYFSEDIKPANEARRTARHSDKLSINEFLDGVNIVLKKTGVLSFIFPSKDQLLVEKLVTEKGMFTHHKTFVQDTVKKQPKRIIYKVGKSWADMLESNIVLKDENGYSPAHIELTRAYYLNLK